MSDATDRLTVIANKAQRLQSDAGLVVEQDLTQAIEYAKYIDDRLAADTASGIAHFGLRFTKLISPGAP